MSPLLRGVCAVRRGAGGGRRPLSTTSCAGWRLLQGEHRVLVSSSSNVFANLAVEDWIYRHWEPSDGGLLFLWRNAPCVVIGRHQNPWLECSLAAMRERGVACARRNSGGGTVFHDPGNLNCTFFSRRPKYDRKANLRLICRAVAARWPRLRLTLSPRDDIFVDDVFKISGTAAKLGHKNAYHHCTVLFNVDKQLLASVLKRRDQIDGLDSKATGSVVSQVKNLGEIDASVHFEALIEAIGNEFQQQFQGEHVSPAIPVLDPNEETFPGLSIIEEQLRSWEWIFGKSPRFKLSGQFTLTPQLQQVTSLENVRLKLQVFQGLIEELSFEPSDWMGESSIEALLNLVGKKFPVGQALTIDGEHWDESDICQQEEKHFIQEAVSKCTSILI